MSFFGVSAAEAVILIFLTVSAVSDLLYQKIFNKSILLFLITGTALVAAGRLPFKGAAAGFLAGALIMMPFYLAGAVGPGDVKFLAAAGFLCADWRGVVYSTLYGAIIAGVCAVFILYRKKMLSRTAARAGQIAKSFLLTGGQIPPAPADSLKLPYVFYLALGFAARLAETKYLAR